MNALLNSSLNYRARQRQARAQMAAENIDALVLTGGPNLTYFTGVSGMLGSNSGSRPSLLVLPQDGEPTIIVQRLLVDEIEGKASNVQVVTYDGLSSLPSQQLRNCLEQLELINGRVGAELGPETTLSVPHSEFVEFTKSYSDATFVDAQPILVNLRCRKSTAEIERIEQACDITTEAFDRTFGDIEEGMSGTEVESLICKHLLELGGNAPWALVTSCRKNYAQTASGGDEYEISDGDMVWIDCGCAVDGYWSDFSRAGVVGGQSERQRRAQQAIHDITTKAIEAIEPGVSISSVAKQAESAVESLDLPVDVYLSRQAGRIGHSLGLQVTELPSISPHTNREFEEGMVVTIEPGFATEYGTFHVEENIVVTTDGTRKLSGDDWKLRSI